MGGNIGAHGGVLVAVGDYPDNWGLKMGNVMIVVMVTVYDSTLSQGVTEPKTCWIEYPPDSETSPMSELYDKKEMIDNGQTKKTNAN